MSVLYAVEGFSVLAHLHSAYATDETLADHTLLLWSKLHPSFSHCMRLHHQRINSTSPSHLDYLDTLAQTHP